MSRPMTNVGIWNNKCNVKLKTFIIIGPKTLTMCHPIFVMFCLFCHKIKYLYHWRHSFADYVITNVLYLQYTWTNGAAIRTMLKPARLSASNWRRSHRTRPTGSALWPSLGSTCTRTASWSTFKVQLISFWQVVINAFTAKVDLIRNRKYSVPAQAPCYSVLFSPWQ